MEHLGRRTMLRNIMLLAGISAVPQGSAKALFEGPRSLPPSTRTLLAAVADTIIPETDTPGAAGAGVPAAFDKLVANWASPAQRAKLVGALDAVEAVARSERKASFATLDPEQRFALLDAYDRAQAGGGDYARLKELVVTLYYLSEIGSTIELRYEHSPGVWEPSIALTAETRNYGGPAHF